MAIEVDMAADIRKYETKEYGIFTKRQFKYVLIGGITGVVFGLLIPVSLMSRIVIGASIWILIVICGFIQIGGLSFEVVILKLYYMNFLTPKKRKCKIENSYRELYKAMKKQDEKDYYKSLSPKEQKAYMKAQKKKTITYSSEAEYKIYR